MSAPSPKSQNLFQVYLRLRPTQAGGGERFLNVEEPENDDSNPKHITLSPPNDRRRAVEKFAFTRVFEEDATQLDVFHCTGVASLVEGVLAPRGGEGTDALLATLGVTGSGKTHTMLGSRSQRGLTQLALDVIFRSLGNSVLDCDSHPTLEHSIGASEPSEATILSASAFIDGVYADSTAPLRSSTRAPTPMIVRPNSPFQEDEDEFYSCLEVQSNSPKSVRLVCREDSVAPPSPVTPKEMSRYNSSLVGTYPDGVAAYTNYSLRSRPGDRYQRSQQGQVPRMLQKSPVKNFMNSTASIRQKAAAKHQPREQGESSGPTQTPSRRLHRPSAFPQQPDVSALSVSCDPSAEYAVVISMYEVYNDRIFDLLTPPIKSAATKEYRRRPLLFKPTENSPDRKVVAGLRKVVCGNLNQALMVLEAGLYERRVTGTGSNSVSSRSHGFFSIEVKKCAKGNRRAQAGLSSSAFTIVDLAGSERARDAKTAGATLAEAGKINESLMYLGQCLQMQSDAASRDKPNLVPFRQCKLTELLFSNSFPSAVSYTAPARYRNPQKAVMIVTADPHGDYNATSQILRYSALAREVTVPRVPSISQTMLAAVPSAPSPEPQPSSSPVESPIQHYGHHYRPGTGGSAHNRFNSRPLSSPNVERTFSPPLSSPAGMDAHRTTMELAALEIARLSEELDYTRAALETEREARQEAEAHLLSMEDRMLEMEQEIREECALEFEQRLEIEMARWRANMQVELERGEEHWGRKIELFERSLAVTVTAPSDHGSYDDELMGGEDKENVLMENVNEENERLRRDNEILRREIAGMSPSKRMPLQERGSDVGSASPTKSSRGKSRSRGSHQQSAAEDEGASLRRRLENLKVSDEASPAPSLRAANGASSTGSPKKMRKLGTKRWDAGMDDEDLF